SSISNSEIETYNVGNLSIDFGKRQIFVNTGKIHLTPNEYKIVELLARNAGKVLTHEFILKEIWGPFATDNQILRVNMASIRKKIEENSNEPKYFLTEPGVGYRITEEI
ncbi:MAG: winged helix-turn-helix domain-containing protein, partial [Clostridiales bacterium]|nr:winged helix-turn-helix domain-containing protein [Clostridiales bacterium]